MTETISLETLIQQAGGQTLKPEGLNLVFPANDMFEIRATVCPAPYSRKVVKE